MLHNTGPYGPNDTPMNMATPVNMNPMSGHLNMAHNINNLSKMAHESVPAPSGHYNLPDYGGYEHPPLGIPPQMPSFPSYQQLAFQPNYMSQNTGHMSDLPWQNGMFPMNMNMQDDHNTNMMNYAYEKRFLDNMRHESLKEHAQNMRKTPLNIPQIPNKTFNKPIGISNDYLPSDPYSNVNYNLDLSMKSSERIQIDSTRRKNIENTVKLIEDILIHSSNKPKEAPKPDFNMEPKQDSYVAKNNIIHKVTETLPSPHTINTTTVIKNTSMMQKKPEPTITEAPRSPEPIIMRLLKQQDPPKQIIPEPLPLPTNDVCQPEVVDENHDPIAIDQNNDDKLDTDDDLSSEEDIKPTGLIDHLNIDMDNGKNIDTVEIKIEKTCWSDAEYLQPFLKDTSGFQQAEQNQCKIIKSDNSVNEAMAVVKTEFKPEACFECPHCNLLFEHPKRFLIHTKWHTFGLTYEKRMEQARERELKRAERKEAKIQERISKLDAADESAGTGTEYPCKDCDKVFYGKSRLKNHRQSVHPTRVRECKICHANVVGWVALRKHIASHTAASGVDFQCPECPKRFKYAHSLAKHADTHLGTGVDFQCPECPKRFKYAHSLAKHADTHLEKVHGCQQCPKKFGSQKLLKMHMKTHERVLKGTTFRCSYCGKGFYEAFSLAVHERTHRNERPFQCEICNTSYGTNSSLKRHLKVSHSTAKPHSCPVCHRNFSTESIRDRHEQRVHGNPEDFKFPCTMCDCRYLKHKDLQKHIYKVHPKNKRKSKKVDMDKSDTE